MTGRELLFIIKARNAARGVINQFRQNLKGVGTAAKSAQAALNKMGKTVKDVGTSATRAAAALRGLGKTGGITKATAKFKSMRKSIGSALKEAITLRGVLAGFGAAFVIRGAFNTLVDFSDEMAKVRAISGATADQFEQLKTKAADLGTTTRFTATQAAEGMTFLSRAGFTANQTLSAIGPTLNLAQAGALDLGRAADIVSNVMSAFGIEAERTNEAVDAMATVANSANTSIDQLGDAMKFAAPLAASLGLSLQETAAAIGALGQAGIQGGSAGAGLQIFLSKLVNLKESSRDAFRAAGVNLKKISPLTNSLEDILSTLADSSFGAAEAIEAFGARGLRTVLSLLKQRATFDRLTQAQKDAAGAGAEFARIMNDQLGGAVKALISAAQGLVIALGETGVINVFEGLIRGIAAVIRTIAAFLTAIGDVVKAIPGLTTVLQALGLAIGILVAATGIPLLILVLKDLAFTSVVAQTATGGFLARFTTKPLIKFAGVLKKGAANLASFTGITAVSTVANKAFSASTFAMLSPVGLLKKVIVALSSPVKLLTKGFGLLAVAARLAGVAMLRLLIPALVVLTAVSAGVVAAITAIVAALAFLEIRGADTSKGTVTLGNLIAASWEIASKSVKNFAIEAAVAINDSLPEFLKIENIAQKIKDVWKDVGDFFTNLGDTLAGGFGKIFESLLPESVITRARQLTKGDEIIAFGKALDVADAAAGRLGSTLTDEEKRLAELGIAFNNGKQRLEAFIAKSNPLVAVNLENARTMEIVAELTGFLDSQLAELGITRKQIAEITRESTQALKDEQQPLRLANIEREFEIGLIGKSALAIEQERFNREQNMAVKKNELKIDKERQNIAEDQFRRIAQDKLNEKANEANIALRQSISLVGLEGAARRARSIDIQAENDLKKIGVSITREDRDAQLALQAVLAQRVVNEENNKRLRDLDDEFELIQRSGVAREIAAAKQNILNDAIRNQTDLVVALAAAEVEAAAIARNARENFLQDFENTKRALAIEAKLINLDAEEVDRLTAAMDAMKDAKEAGFNTADIKRFGEEAVVAFDAIKEAQDKFQEDGLNGFRRAMDDYISESKRFADQWEDITVGAIRKTEDALQEFVETGKLDFRSLLTSILNDISRTGIRNLLGKAFEGLRGLNPQGGSSSQVAGTAATLLGPDAIQQQIQVSAEVTAKAIIAGGQTTATAITTSGKAVTTALNAAATSSGTAIRIAGNELSDCLRAVCASIEACVCGGEVAGGGISVIPRARPSQIQGATDFITEGGDRDMVTLGDGPPGALQAFQQQTALQAKNLGTFLAEGNKDYAKVLKTATEQTAMVGETFTGQLGNTFGDLLSGLGSTFSSILSGAGNLISSLFGGGGGAAIGNSLLNIGTSFLSSFSFAKGGVMAANGAVQLQRFAGGGIANSPSLAVFGEGDGPEAFVPLPDGRRIPVDMRGGEPQRPINVNVIQNIQTPDVASFGRNREQLARQGALAFQRSMARDN